MFPAKAAILSHTMKRWSWHRTRILFLAFWLGLGMSLSVVQGGAMAVEMTLAADHVHHGPNGCDGCGGGDHNNMNASSCLAVCGTASPGLTPEELLTLLSVSRTDLQSARLSFSSQFHSPDHGPPKILSLG
jgi:hypothetical protein